MRYRFLETLFAFVFFILFYFCFYFLGGDLFGGVDREREVFCHEGVVVWAQIVFFVPWTAYLPCLLKAGCSGWTYPAFDPDPENGAK